MSNDTVTDVYRDQVRIGPHWYHAERVLGRPATSFTIGETVSAFEQPRQDASTTEDHTDVYLSADLFRESGANITCPAKIERYAQDMREYGGWGAFPPISGYVDTVSQEDVDLCMELIREGNTSTWLSEKAWSRLITIGDIGKTYIQITEGHHRAHAAKILHDEGMPISVPAHDLRAEEAQPRYAMERQR